MIEQIGIVGAGTMGNGIAQVCAAAGLKVTMADISDAALARGISVVTSSLERLVNKQKMTDADRNAALSRIATTTDTAKFVDCDLVIEAATENEDLKVKILKDICSKVRPSALVATNTSSISITKLAAATDRPDRFIGLHFFNPVPLMALLELIRGLQTSDDTHAKAEAFAKRIGKVSITAKNSPGFAVNRILCPMINEAIFALAEGLATYVEGIARAQFGNRDISDVWAEYRHSMPLGLPRAGEGGMDQTPSWGRTYWGGALYCLQSDIAIREGTGNRIGLQTALRAILRETGGYRTERDIDEVLRIGDAATGTRVLEDLYRETKTTPQTPDLDRLWARLGVPDDPKSQPFDSHAPLAAIRAAITATPSGSR